MSSSFAASNEEEDGTSVWEAQKADYGQAKEVEERLAEGRRGGHCGAGMTKSHVVALSHEQLFFPPVIKMTLLCILIGYFFMCCILSAGPLFVPRTLGHES